MSPSADPSQGCVPCSWGYYSDKTVCTRCPAGKYDSIYPSPTALLGRSSSAICYPCPDNSNSPNTSYSIAACTCNAGYWTKPASGGSFSCIPCGLGSFSLQNFTVCTACDIGYYSDTSTASGCTQCNFGLPTMHTGSTSSEDCACPCGNYRLGNECKQCPAGKYGLGGDSPCIACNASSYTQAPGQCACLVCGTNKAARNDGTGCICSPGFYSNGDVCSPCTPGRFARLYPSGNTSCEPCLNNSYNPLPMQITCIQCPSNSKAAPGVNLNISVCVCQSGTMQNNSCVTSSRTPPKTGNPSAGGNPVIASCPAGQEPDPDSNKASCRACAAGFYKDLSTGTDTKSCSCCPAGTYKPIQGTMGCTLCPLNSVANTGGCGGSDLSSCLCNAGSYNSNETGGVMCVLCSLGTSSGGPGGQGACPDCPAGFFQNATGATACIGCPIGSSTWNKSSLVSQSLTGSRSGISCSCNQGYSQSASGACLTCPSGTYTDPLSLDNKCISCPEGKFSASVGATTGSACIACRDGSNSNISITGASSITACKCFPGYTGQDGDYCTPCDMGTYKNASGSSPCLACSSGFYQNARASTACLACPLNAVTQATASRAVNDCQCLPGYQYNDTVSGPVRFLCSACAPGQYKNVTGSSACIGCPQGTYNPNSSSTSPLACIGCPQGASTSAVVSVYYGYTAVQDCKCNKGFEATDPSQVCTACNPGTYKDWYGLGLCAACGSGFYQPSYSAQKPISCMQCPPNTVTDSTTNDVNTTCKCKLGFTARCDGVACSRCPAGTFKNVTGSSSCSPCPLNTYNSFPGSNSSAACLACPSNSVTLSPGSRFRLNCLCGPGYTQTASSGECVPCLTGYYKSNYSSDPCVPCPLATYGENKGMSSCAACTRHAMTVNVGTSQASDCLCNAGYAGLGSEACWACLAGQYKTGMGNEGCTNCSVGFYSPKSAMDSPACALCPRYSTTLSAGSTALANCTCRIGYQDTRATQTAGPTCEACSPGKYRDNLSLTACAVCPIGAHAAVNGSVLTCAPCPPSMTTAANGSISLAACQCVFGYFREDQTNPLSCSPCLPGTYSDSLGPYPCDPCRTGTYANGSGASSCTPCPADFITLAQGSDSIDDCKCDKGHELVGRGSCIPCAQGKFKSDAGIRTSCVGCPLNSYAPQQGSTSCTSCALFANTLLANSTSPLECACIPGYYGSNETAGNPQAVCLPCPVGTYKTLRGSGACTVCPVNLTTAMAASSSLAACRQCTRGSVFQCTSFECQCRPCSNCTKNQYLVSSCNDTHDTVCSNCTNCMAGQYTVTKCGIDGPGTCTCCQPGTFSVDGTVSSCQPCQAGSYSTGLCTTSCSLCQLGFYQTDEGATNCTPCKQGKYQPDLGNNCTDCGAGTYQNETGGTFCKGCEAGKYSTGIGIPRGSECACCAKNQYQMVTGQSSCQSCQRGSYSHDSCCALPSCCLSCEFWNLTCPAPDQQCASSAFVYNGSWRAASIQVGTCPACPAGKYFLFDAVNPHDPTQASFIYPTLNFQKTIAISTQEIGVLDAMRLGGQDVDMLLSVSDEMGLNFIHFIKDKNAASYAEVQYSAAPTGPSSMLLHLKTYIGDKEFRNEMQLPVFRFGVFGLNYTSSLRVFKADGLIDYLSGDDILVEETDVDVHFQYSQADSAGSNSGIILYFSSVSSITLKIESTVDIMPAGIFSIKFDGNLSVIKETDFEKPSPLNPTLQSRACRCASCAQGKYSTMIGSMSEFNCKLCEPGMYSAQSDASVCRSCPLGSYRQYSGGAGNISCSACPIGGYASSTGATGCVACDTGKFTVFTGSTAPSDCILTCAEGKYLVASNMCQSCWAGTFSLRGQSCQECAPGTYSAISAASSCAPCQTGTYAVYHGATACISVQNLTSEIGASIICPNCSNLGSYYRLCSNGTYSTDLAATVCSNCSAGSFASAPGAQWCNLCSPGQYSLSGFSSCVKCPAGTWSAVTGLNSTSGCIRVTTSDAPTATQSQPTVISSSAASLSTVLVSVPSSTSISGTCAQEGPEQVGNYICSGGNHFQLRI